ncbi:DUF5817 domain-containing protein [Halocatena pleomorpha]|uniref:ArsR family transcriptional regulator n=1 Tax=Halocatena pleomorpha TaxID=1785090 RepID=A0A3P3RKD5_9EURY|nr:DUF5817 domain-containing protein [Halocatena pleomorpha]RRJ33997.1 ArsR family transcriptional regulator [Halocatena pleomorpha]
MTTPARFAIVGCSVCESLWIIGDRHHRETAHCPLCSTTHTVEKLRPRFQHNDRDVVCEVRSRLLAQQAGYEDRYEAVDDYAVLEEQANEYLARYDHIAQERAEAYLNEQDTRFKTAAEDYLDRQESLYEEQAKAYLDRREQELNDWVNESVSTAETPSTDTDLTPFTEQADPSLPAGTGITLTTPETLPETTDVRLDGPPIAPTKLWKQLWQTGDLVARLRDALDTLRGATYREAWATLTQAGVTAPATAEHPAYAEYLLDALKHKPTEEKWTAIVRLTRQLGGMTAIGQTTRADIITGAVALFVACDVVPQVTIRLSHAFFADYQRNQRETFLRFLTDLSMAFDIRIECAGRILPKKLATQHNEELPERCLTDAPDSYHLNTNQLPGTPEEVAACALDELGVEHAYYDVLDALAATPSNRRQFAALRDDPTFDVTANGMQKRVDRLRELKLVSVDQLNADAFVQLLPAGEELLALRAKERLAQARLDEYATVPDAEPTSENATEADVTDPPKPPNKTVCSARARKGDPGSAASADSTAAGTAPATAMDGSAPTSRCFWLPPAQQHAIVASCTGEDAGPDIALADEPAPTREQPRDCWVGYDENRKEVVVSLQPSPVAAYTMTRVCAGLLSPLLRNTILTAADLDGADGEELGKLLDTGVSTAALRNIHQLGCLPDRSANGTDYREELTEEYVGIIEDVPQIQTEEGFDGSLARSVCQRAHGFAGTVMRIYELLGWEVTQEWTFPDYRYSEHKRRHIYHQTLAKHIAIVSRYGGYPAHRILYEEDDDLRADSLGCPNVDGVDPTGECFGNWVLRGPGIDRMAADLTDLEAAGELELQDEAQNYTPFLVELQIGQATRKATVEAAATRMCELKDLRLTRSAAALLAAFTDSVFNTAEALAGLATARDFDREITLDEVRFALSTLDPATVLPNLDMDGDDAGRKSARSKIVHTLLTASAPLTTGELAERASVSTQSIRNHRDDLAAIGLVAIDDRGVGKATYYRLTLPFRDERGDSDALKPLHLPDGEGGESTHNTRDVVYDLLDARDLLDDAFGEAAINEGLMGWPPDLQPAVERWPWLRPWIDTIDWLFGYEGRVSLRGPGEWIDGPYELITQLGTEPETTQSQLLV